MIQTISIIFLSVISTLSTLLFIIQKKRTDTVIATTIQLLMLKEEEQQNNKTDKEKSNEDFLKFVSDSRDWAYQYIEDVQEKINKFISDLEPEIAYFDEYGIIGEGYPHYHSMKKISGAYKELKKLLPEDYDRIE
jgi:hypothetical protein